MINKLQEAISKFYDDRFSVEYKAFDNGSVCNFHFCDGTYFSLTANCLTEDKFDEILKEIDRINEQKRKIQLVKENDPEFYKEMMKDPKVQEQEEIINRYQQKTEAQ